MVFGSIYKIKKKFPLAVFIVVRLVTMCGVLLLLGLAVFALMALSPGDIVDKLIMQQVFASSESGALAAVDAGVNAGNTKAEQIEARKNELGLDKPFYIQYVRYLERVIFHGDLGLSLISRAPVSFLIKSRIVNSLTLNLISLVLITVSSFALGVWFSSKAGTVTDTALTFFMLVLHAFPGILMLILFQLFAAVTNLFPVTAYPDFPFAENPGAFVFSYMHHIFLPLLASFLGGIGGTIRMIRSTMLDQLSAPYITALRSRGIKEWRIYLFHAFRNTLNPYITGSANLLASLFSGSLILEIMFAYPGVGRLMYEAVLQEDINLVLANIMFVSFLTLLGMAISDILLAIVDPRIKYD
ncbi:MAG: ABC transporter permease [Treponemataceae bacterium]|nr:MAG: ABC transporter permease [Treponemataceae bacterium]